MQKIIMILLAFFMFACSDSGDGGAKVETTSPTVNPVTENHTPVNPIVGGDDVSIALYTSAELKFYNGNISSWFIGKTARAASRIYSAGNVLYYLNADGSTNTSYNLVTTPDFIRVNGTDKWIIKKIDPVTAQSLGAQYKHYTRVYLNSTEYGFWANRQFECDDVAIVDGELYAHGTTGGWRHITGSNTNILHAQDGLVIYGVNTVNHIGYINDVYVSWSTNSLNGASQWQKSGTIWYSQNGYSFDGSTLVEDGLVMSELRSIQNVVIAAGVRNENSEDVLYWIDCATGWVIRHVTSTNQRSNHVRLYVGDGDSTTGIYYKALLKPCLAGDKLYFIFDAQIYVYDFTSGLTSHFTSGVSEVWIY
jgi:hypothetical protein